MKNEVMTGSMVIPYGKALVRDINRPLATMVILDGIEIPMDNEFMLVIPHLTLQGTGSYSDINHSKSCKKTTVQLYHDYVLQMVGIGFNPVNGRIIDGVLLASTLVGFRLNGMVVHKNISIARAMEFKLSNRDNFPVALPSLKSVGR